MFLLNKWKTQPQLRILLRKTCYFMEIAQENFCIFNRFFPTQNNRKLAVEKSSVSTESIHTNPPTVRNQSTQILRQFANNPHKSSVSTQSIHTNPPSVCNQSTQILRQYAINPHKSTVSTQSIHTNPPLVRNLSTQIFRQYAINPHKSSVSTL